MPSIVSKIKFADIKKDDEIVFDYTNSHTHDKMRVGVVIDFPGSIEKGNLCVRIHDYSLCDGPKPQSYRMEYIENLGRIEQITPDEMLNIEMWFAYQNALIRFRRRLENE